MADRGDPRWSCRRHVCALAFHAVAMTVATPALSQNPPAVPSQEVQDKARLADAMAQALMPLDLNTGALGGKGGDWLKVRIANADIVMFGETHGTGSIAETAGLIVDALPRDQPLAYALETDPFAAERFEPLLRGAPEALEAQMADPRRANAAAFLFLREEVALARKVLARAAPGMGAFWGLDQAFVSAAPMLLDRLEGWAETPAQRTAVAEARKTFAPFMAIATVPESSYEPLERAFADGPEKARHLIAEMRLSTRIYHLQESATNQSNRLREDYMKRNFLAHWRAAGTSPPRVVMKFGAYHLVSGLSPTATPALGGFVDALALIDGKTRFSILILCGPDGEQTSFQGIVASCADDFAETGAPFAPYLRADGATLIDTAPLRLIPGTIRRQGFSEDLRSYVQSYDAILIHKGARAARPFAPIPASWFETP